MSDVELTLRIKRIYAALGAVKEKDLNKLKAKVIQDGSKIGFYQDWEGSLSYEEISNYAISLIHNVANLKDNLKKWAKRNGKDKNRIELIFNDSQALKVIQDLSNNDKHGYPPRDGGFSGKSPKVEKFERVMRMSAKGGKGSFISMTFNKQGVPQVSKSGTSEAEVIITGKILDRDKNEIGELYEILSKAISDWGELLREFGVQIPSD